MGLLTPRFGSLFFYLPFSGIYFVPLITGQTPLIIPTPVACLGLALKSNRQPNGMIDLT